MKSKIVTAACKAVAAAKAEIWGEDQPGSPNPVAAADAVAPGRDREVEALRNKLSHMREGLESVLARVAYLERCMHNKERNVGVGACDRLVGPNRLKKGLRRNEKWAKRAKELWGEEEEEGGGGAKREIKKGQGKHGEKNIKHETDNSEPENGQQGSRPKKKRKGKGGGEGGAKKKSPNEASL